VTAATALSCAALLFSALALATSTRIAAVATGFNADPALKAVLQWVPTICWASAGAILIYLERRA
jgi:hypothetical protein